jgi:heptosyltransferase-2
VLNPFSIKFKPWNRSNIPRRILAIRCQALGDVVITLPYLNSLKEQLPNTTIDFLTLEENAAIPKSLLIFDKVFSIRGGRNGKFQFVYSICLLPFLWLRRYDVVLDLQNHRISKIIRRFLQPKAWCEFDKFSPNSAGERNRMTINSVGLKPIELNTQICQKTNEQKTDAKLKDFGWKPKSKLIVLNPAGAFETRHWPLQNYLELAKKWLILDPTVQFLAIGLRHKIGSAVDSLKEHFGDSFIDLTGKTNIAEAFAMLRRASLIITEDGGLMHMAWVQGVPTLALFGSTRSDWSAPLGHWSICLNSSDLPCGNCLLEFCKFGDVHCLTRYSPEYVLQRALQLIERCSPLEFNKDIPR